MAETPWKPPPVRPSVNERRAALGMPPVELEQRPLRPWHDATGTMRATPWANSDLNDMLDRLPPMFGETTRGDRLANKLFRDIGGGVTRTVRARRVWRPMEDTAARFAAPWFALVWLLTGGRMGAPLWRWERLSEFRQAK